MVEYHETQVPDDERMEEQRPRRRRATYRPVSARQEPDDPGAAEPTPGGAPAPDTAPEPELPPTPLPAPNEGDDADHDGAPDGTSEQGEPDVIVPAAPDETEPAPQDAAPRRSLAVLFQAPPAPPPSEECLGST